MSHKFCAIVIALALAPCRIAAAQGEQVLLEDAFDGSGPPGSQWTGGVYRPDEDVDLLAATGNASGYVVHNFETGEWLEYTINVTATGTYNVTLNAAEVPRTSVTPALSRQG